MAKEHCIRIARVFVENANLQTPRSHLVNQNLYACLENTNFSTFKSLENTYFSTLTRFSSTFLNLCSTALSSAMKFQTVFLLLLLLPYFCQYQVHSFSILPPVIILTTKWKARIITALFNIYSWGRGSFLMGTETMDSHTYLSVEGKISVIQVQFPDFKTIFKPAREEYDCNVRNDSVERTG